MKVLKSLFISSMVATSTTNAFNTPTSAPTPTPTRGQFLKHTFTTTAGIVAFLPQSSSAASSSRGKEVSGGDPFALPSYSDAVSNKAIDMKLDDINKKVMDDAAARRDNPNVDRENNERMIELRQEEAEEEKRLARMKALAQKEREERIAREKAETKANRWNTF